MLASSPPYTTQRQPASVPNPKTLAGWGDCLVPLLSCQSDSTFRVVSADKALAPGVKIHTPRSRTDKPPPHTMCASSHSPRLALCNPPAARFRRGGRKTTVHQQEVLSRLKVQPDSTRSQKSCKLPTRDSRSDTKKSSLACTSSASGI